MYTECAINVAAVVVQDLSSCKYPEALQCIYAITKRVVLAVDEEEIPEGIELLDIVLERQLSYFSDLEV